MADPAPKSRITLGLLIVILLIGSSDGQSFGMHMYHKFSEEVKGWISLKDGIDTSSWPTEHSSEYYEALYNHDHARHRRNLAEYGPLTFLAGNKTYNYDDLGYLFYSHVQIGTPNITVLVALDTGSDLFWVPCNCKQCAGNSSEHNTYNSSASSTSSRVTCGNALCDLKQNCSSTSDQCPYYIQYASDNTSSSGVLVEDILYLTPENTSLKGKVVKAPITFGCGMVQTGALLEGTASYGLLGLGMESISVPSTLSKQNLVANSFSICFPRPQDGSAGRFVFGEKGSLDQKEAPFSILKSDLGYSLSYYVSIQEIYVGKTSFKANSTALFDSGTSFTYFTTSVYRSLASYYDSQVKDPPVETAEDIPFEYCYQSSNNQSQNTAQNVSLNIGGSNFKVIHPWVTLADESGNAVGYCLAVLESSSLSIIGQNFMRGYKLVFNREKGTYGTLGWEEANCLDLSDNDIGYASSGNNTTSAAGPSTYGTSWISNNTDENSSHNTSTEGSVSPQSAASKLSRSSFLSFSAVSFVCIVILEFAF